MSGYFLPSQERDVAIDY